MSKAACKEEENGLLLEVLDRLGRRIAVFESFMRQGLATEFEINERIQDDRTMRQLLEKFCDRYGKVNRTISRRDP